MCGIVGLIGRADKESVQSMITRIKHRGPDDEGISCHSDATLGMTRLAIVDIAHGHQPMSNEDGSVVLVFNGEIYNAPAVRRELGVYFRTRSDTEVILRLYEHDPDNVERYLVGMWAFCIHDRKRRKIILSRDRFGIKPLFISKDRFASELRCFDNQEIDPVSAHAMVSWSYVPENRTIYKGVTRLPPATRMTVDLATGQRDLRTYWKLRPSVEAGKVKSLEDASDGISFLLRRAVQEHLESDVPIATFLSGGIDSSLVTDYAHEFYPVHAFTMGFEEQKYDESPYARETAKLLNVPLSVLMLNEAKALDALPDALAAYDEPFGDSSCLPTYILSQYVSKHFKVCLSGDGGDEVFAGYKKYVVANLRSPFSSASYLRNKIGSILRDTKFNKIGMSLEGTDADVYARLSPWLSLEKTKRLMCQPITDTQVEQEIRERFCSAEGNELQKTLASDLGSMLPNDMLTKVDRASMSCGLEVRVPFLDHRLVEYGVGLPSKFTVGPLRRTFKGKIALRALHERRLNSELANRPKMGFSIPIKKWLQSGKFDALFEKSRLDKFGILSSQELSDGGFQVLAFTHPNIAWHCLALATWCENMR